MDGSITFSPHQTIYHTWIYILVPEYFSFGKPILLFTLDRNTVISDLIGWSLRTWCLTRPSIYSKQPIRTRKRALMASHPQATISSTFIPPPLDGTLTIPQIYDFHLEHNPEHVLFVYDGKDGDVNTISWGRAARAIHTAAKAVDCKVGVDLARLEGEREAPAVGILAVIGRFSSSFWP